MNHEHIFVHRSLVLFENKHRLNTIKLATGNVCVCVCVYTAMMVSVSELTGGPRCCRCKCWLISAEKQKAGDGRHGTETPE